MRIFSGYISFILSFIVFGYAINFTIKDFDWYLENSKFFLYINIISYPYSLSLFIYSIITKFWQINKSKISELNQDIKVLELKIENKNLMKKLENL